MLEVGHSGNEVNHGIHLVALNCSFMLCVCACVRLCVCVCVRAWCVCVCVRGG